MLKKALFLLTFLSIFALGLTAVGSQSEDEDSSDEGICDRSDVIQEAILSQVSAMDCAEVGLTELGTVYNLYLTGLDSLKEGDFDGLVGLNELHLSGNGLTELPDGVFHNLTNLAYLELSVNNLSSLPVGVFDNLTNLHFLFLNNNNLSSLPDGVFDNLTGLYQLYLENNNLALLPDGVFENLTSLRYLDTTGNGFKCIPPGAFGSRNDDLSRITLGQFRSPISICVPGEGICDRSDVIQEAILSQVSAMDCAEVGLTELGTVYNLYLTGLDSLKEGDFDGLVGLNELHLSGNGLTELPDGVFHNLTNLEYLELSVNNLNSLPVGVFDNLTNLHFLFLNNNNLSSLPDGVFDNLTGLYQLYLENNNLALLPDGVFENLTSLRYLDTTGNGFKCIPPGAFGSRNDDLSRITLGQFRSPISICVPDGDVCDRSPVVRDAIIESLSAVACDEVELTDLVSLRLSSKGIDSLQAGDFDDLTGLKFLDISSNNLSLLPAGIFDDLAGLTSLDISSNNLSLLPAGVFDGSYRLQLLDLSGNGLGSLPDDVFDELTGLRRLDLSGNSLDSLPDDVFDNLSSLNLLYFVGSDDMDSLPDDVFDNLERLEYLSFRGDSLTSLPDGVFDNLTGLKGLFIVSSDLASLPADVFDNLVNLEGLGIVSSSLVALPSDVSDGKPNLDASKLYLYNNSLVSPEFDFFGRERVVPPMDDTSPEVSLVAPVAGTFNGTVNFSASSSDDFSGVERVEFGYGPVGDSVEWFSGNNVGEGVWNASLNTSGLQNGSYNLNVRSFDFAGNNVSVLGVVVVVFDNPVNVSSPPEPEVVPEVEDPVEDEDPVEADDSDSERGGSNSRDDRDDEPVISSSQHSDGPGQTRSVYRVPAGSTAKFDFTLSDVPVYLIRFDVSNSVRNARVTVSNDSERPSAVSEDYDNPVYSYVTINKSNVDDSSVSNVTIGFSVDEDFVSDNNASEDDVVLVRYVDGEWVETDMRLISSAGSTYSYEASSEGFGYYVITLKAAPSVEGASESSPVVAEPGVEKLPEPEDVVPEGPDRNWVLYTMIAAIAVIVLIGGMAVFVHMRPGKFSHEDVEDTDDAGEGVSNSLAA